MNRADRRSRRLRARPLLAMAIAAALAAMSALAAQESPPTLETTLSRLPSTLRAQLLQRAATWNAWTPVRQQAFRQRLAAWDALPREQQLERRERYAAWLALDAQDRAALRLARGHYATLPATEQAALRARFEELDASLRRGWLLGPRLGADYAALRPLLIQVPPGQRQPLLDVLRAMTPRERADLAILAARTPPQERDELRRALLSTSAANRAAWLQLRLER